MVDTVTLTAALGNIPSPTPITTGAAPVEADLMTLAYEITSGGTAGVEEVDLPYFDPAIALVMLGRRLVFSFANQTNGSDTIKFTVDGGDTIYYYPSEAFSNAGERRTVEGVVLNAEGQYAAFIWNGSDWWLDYALSSISSAPAPRAINLTVAPGAAGADVTLQGNDVTGGGNAGSVNLNGGAGDTGSGGSVNIVGGNAPAGYGGGINMSLGTGSEDNGYLFISGLPTADPGAGYAGAIWNDSGTLKVSAG